MSDHEQTSPTTEAESSQIHNARTGKSVGHDNDESTLQSDTIKHLDKILADYTAQQIELFDGCQFISPSSVTT